MNTFIQNIKKKITFWQFLGLLAVMSLPNSAFASEMGVYAWETILKSIADSITGPVAYAISILAIAICGLAMAFADLQTGAKRFVEVACGLSIVFFATQITTGFLRFSGAII